MIGLAVVALIAPAHAGDLAFGYSPTVDPAAKPWFTVTPARDVLSLQVVITAGAQSYKFTKANLPGGKPVKFEWARDPSVNSAEVAILVEYTDHYEEELSVPLTYSYGGTLTVDLSHASADVAARTLTVSVTGKVDQADVVAYGAHKAELDRRTVTVNAGPGTITVPWVGAPSEVVLLDVTLHSGGAWSGFTYSPWFLDIPHDDVLFETDQSAIRAIEEPKLQAVLAQLADVIDKYGAVVPVKLYIAGCTDTAGDASHNEELSRARAKSIASWLRAHGYSREIYYHGYGESWLAVATPDGTDEPGNRRAVYMVGANPPPSGSGVPPVSWTAL